MPGDAVFATCVHADHDPAARIRSVALAGHPPPPVVAADGAVAFPDLPHGTPLGFGIAPYEAAELMLPAGSTIALHSDGLVEERHEDIDVGMRRVSRAPARPADSLEDLARAVIGTLPAEVPGDDVTLLPARGR